MSSALNEDQWTYNFVSAVRDDGSDRGVARIHADKRPGLRGKLDPIFPGSGAALLTHCFVYVRLECRFLGTSGTDEPQALYHLSARRKLGCVYSCHLPIALGPVMEVQLVGEADG